MKDPFLPGDKPFAASALIVHPDGLFLSVSRKHDPDDLGLPGGKLDPGENFVDAVIRETKEETGLEVVQLEPIFGDYCGNPEIHVVHWCLTFICKAQGEIKTSEKGRVLWIPPGRLIEKEPGVRNSFGWYNLCVLARLSATQFDTRPYYSQIPLDPKHVL